MQHECFLAYAPRGAGLLCAVAYVSGEPDIVGWFVGAKGRSYPSAYFRVENFFSAEQKPFCATAVSDIYGGGRYHYARADRALGARPLQQQSGARSKVGGRSRRSRALLTRAEQHGLRQDMPVVRKNWIRGIACLSYGNGHRSCGRPPAGTKILAGPTNQGVV